MQQWCNSGANSVQSISVDSAKFERYQVFATLSLKGLKQESYGSLGDSSAAFRHIRELGSVRVPPSPPSPQAVIVTRWRPLVCAEHLREEFASVLILC